MLSRQSPDGLLHGRRRDEGRGEERDSDSVYLELRLKFPLVTFSISSEYVYSVWGKKEYHIVVRLMHSFQWSNLHIRSIYSNFHTTGSSLWVATNWLQNSWNRKTILPWNEEGRNAHCNQIHVGNAESSYKYSREWFSAFGLAILCGFLYGNTPTPINYLKVLNNEGEIDRSIPYRSLPSPHQVPSVSLLIMVLTCSHSLLDPFSLLSLSSLHIHSFGIPSPLLLSSIFSLQS